MGSAYCKTEATAMMAMLALKTLNVLLQALSALTVVSVGLIQTKTMHLAIQPMIALPTLRSVSSMA
jgi:hypothetical protein